MDAFLAFPEARRRALYEQAGQVLGLEAASIEKDFWVCWTLRELFALPNMGLHLTFKGGTSCISRSAPVLPRGKVFQEVNP